jgi:hypothetical protein
LLGQNSAQAGNIVDDRHAGSLMEIGSGESRGTSLRDRAGVGRTM